MYEQMLRRSVMACVRPDYFEVHAVAQDSSRSSTSRCVLVRPAATSARPRRTAAIMRSSSAISSSEAFSGSLCSASRTACLSVMDEEYPSPLHAASCCTPQAPNAKVSDGSQPPMTFDLSLSESAGSRSLHRLVGPSYFLNALPFPRLHSMHFVSRFSETVSPPSDHGMIWSIWSSTPGVFSGLRPQARQRNPSRSRDRESQSFGNVPLGSSLCPSSFGCHGNGFIIGITLPFLHPSDESLERTIPCAESVFIQSSRELRDRTPHLCVRGWRARDIQTNLRLSKSS